jgi:hypothetical protein
VEFFGGEEPIASVRDVRFAYSDALRKERLGLFLGHNEVHEPLEAAWLPGLLCHQGDDDLVG